MIVEGVEEVDDNVFTFTQQAATELIKDLEYAILEAEDHKISYPISIRIKTGHIFNSLVLQIKPK